ADAAWDQRAVRHVQPAVALDAAHVVGGLVQHAAAQRVVAEVIGEHLAATEEVGAVLGVVHAVDPVEHGLGRLHGGRVLVAAPAQARRAAGRVVRAVGSLGGAPDRQVHAASDLETYGQGGDFRVD